MNESKNKMSTNQSDLANANSLDLMQLLKIVWDSRKFVWIVIGTITVLAVVYSLMMKDTFKSIAVVLPDADKSKLSSLGGLSDLAALAGVNVGGEVPIVRLYPTFIKSEAVLRNVIFKNYKTILYSDSVNLLQYWEIKEKTPERDFETAIRVLREMLEITPDPKTSVLTISLETNEPQLSADILNTILYEMDKFIRTKKNTNASEQRKWIETRLNEVKIDLDNSENNLKSFREKNRIVIGSPKLMLEQERLLRDVQINSALYIELKKQCEIAKVEEIKSVKIVSVLDYPRPAARKEGPKRSIIVLSSILLAFFGSSSYVITKQKYGDKFIYWYGQIKRLISH